MWLPVALTLRADSSLPCNFLFRGKSRLQPTEAGRGRGGWRWKPVGALWTIHLICTLKP